MLASWLADCRCQSTKEHRPVGRGAQTRSTQPRSSEWLWQVRGPTPHRGQISDAAFGVSLCISELVQSDVDCLVHCGANPAVAYQRLNRGQEQSR